MKLLILLVAMLVYSQHLTLLKPKQIGFIFALTNFS